MQRKTFPQMRLYQIKEFPIPNASLNDQRELEKLVREMIELNKNDQDIDEMSILNNSIDEFVMNLYKLTDEEKDIIRDFKVIR